MTPKQKYKMQFNILQEIIKNIFQITQYNKTKLGEWLKFLWAAALQVM